MMRKRASEPPSLTETDLGDDDQVAAVLAKFGFPKLSMLEATTEPNLAQILSYLNEHDLQILCRISQRISLICKKYRLHARLHTHQVFRFYDGEWVLHTFDNPGFPRRIRQFLGDNSRIYTLDEDGEILIWDRNIPKEPHNWKLVAPLHRMPREATKVISLATHEEEGRMTFIYAITDSGQLIAVSLQWLDPVIVTFPPDDKDPFVTSFSCHGSANTGFRVALTRSGNVYTWGRNFNGSLGVKRKLEENIWDPTRVKFPTATAERIIMVKCSYNTEIPMTIALSASGKVYGWGKVRRGYGTKWKPILLPLDKRLPPIISIQVGKNTVVFKYENGNFSIWNTSKNIDVPFETEEIEQIFPRYEKGGLYILAKDGTFFWHSNDEEEATTEKVPGPVRLFSIRNAAVYCLTAPEVQPWFIPIGAFCLVCSHPEPENVAWTKDGSANLFCGQQCYSKFFSLY